MIYLQYDILTKTEDTIMELKELRKQKSTLESGILELVQKFNKETLMSIDSIEVKEYTQSLLNGETVITQEVKVEVKI